MSMNPNQFDLQTGQKLPLMAALPPEFGKTPIPEGSVRFHHRTKNPAALPSIMENGLQVAHAEGENYGEANQVWATGQAGKWKGNGTDETHHVEFHAVPSTDLDIGSRGTQESLEDRSVTMLGDVPRRNIVAAHEPWHQHARYIQGEYPEEIRAGTYNTHDNMLTDKVYGPAVRYAKGPEFKDHDGNPLQ